MSLLLSCTSGTVTLSLYVCVFVHVVAAVVVVVVITIIITISAAIVASRVADIVLAVRGVILCASFLTMWVCSICCVYP